MGFFHGKNIPLLVINIRAIDDNLLQVGRLESTCTEVGSLVRVLVYNSENLTHQIQKGR